MHTILQSKGKLSLGNGRNEVLKKKQESNTSATYQSPKSGNQKIISKAIIKAYREGDSEEIARGGFGMIHGFNVKISSGNIKKIKQFVAKTDLQDGKFLKWEKLMHEELSDIKHLLLDNFVKHGLMPEDGTIIALKKQPLDQAQKVSHKAFACIAKGLVSLHERKYAHKDIKPANLFISLTDKDKAYLGDLGAVYRAPRQGDPEPVSVCAKLYFALGFIEQKGKDDLLARYQTLDKMAFGLVLLEALDTQAYKIVINEIRKFYGRILEVPGHADIDIFTTDRVSQNPKDAEKVKNNIAEIINELSNNNNKDYVMLIRTLITQPKTQSLENAIKILNHLDDSELLIEDYKNIEIDKKEKGFLESEILEEKIPSKIDITKDKYFEFEHTIESRFPDEKINSLSFEVIKK